MEPGGGALTARSTGRPTPRLWVSAAFAAAAVLAANAPWSRAYAPGEAFGLLAGAAALSTGIPLLLGPLARRGAWSSMATSIAGFVGYCLAAALGGDAGGLARGLGDGLARLLSESLPVATPHDLLVPALAATWCTGAVCGELVARTRAAAACGVVLAAAFALSDAVTASVPGQPLGAAAVLVVLAAALLAVAPRRAEGQLVAPTGGRVGRRRPALRPLAGAAVTLAAATAIAVVAVPSLPGWPAAPTAPARLAPVRTSQPVTPTATAVELRDGPLRRLFSVRVDRATAGYLPVAELDTYDGSSWGLDQLFRPSGGNVPTGPGSPPGGRRVVQRYAIDAGLGMPWMPLLSRPLDVQGVAVDVAALSGMVLPARPLVAGQRYVAVSSVPAATLADAPTTALAAPPPAPPLPEDLAVPPAEQRELAGFAAQLATRTHIPATEPLALLRAVEADLVAHDRTIAPPRGRHRQPAPADTTFADAVHAVVVARRATPEQYATFFALLARHLGVPARLATGFRLTGPTGTLRPGRRYTVTSADAWTWAELDVSALGWVVADPSPAHTGTAPLPAASAAPTAPATTLPPVRAVPRPAPSGHALAPAVHPPLGGAASGATAALATLAALGLLGAAALLALLAARARRRRQRRRGPAGDAVAGAWLEALDALTAAGLGDLRSLTAAEVVEAARQHFGEGAALVAPLAQRANLAVFSSRPDRIAEAEAVASWSDLAALRRTLRAAVPRRTRLRHALRTTRPRWRPQAAPPPPDRPRHHGRRRPAPSAPAAPDPATGSATTNPGRSRVSSSTDRAGSGTGS